MMRKQTKCGENLMKVLCIMGAVLILIDVVGEFITYIDLGRWPFLFGTIFYTALSLLIIFMCIKSNKPIFRGSVILISGVVILILGIIRLMVCEHIVLYNYIWWIVILTIIAGIMVIVAGISFRRLNRD
ncbi:hypothetical protein KAX75_12265 [candidate division WOR-3 bacterium]|nr:hypothetical protein [candidate division WOR-3 bacterium]